MRNHRLGAVALAMSLALAACGDAARPRVASSGGAPSGATDPAALAACTRCHGDATNGNAAPPRSVAGATAASAVGVGAHQQHLHDSAFRKAVACAECHVVPAAVTDAGHIDAGQASLAFGALATANGAAPAWDRTSATCSGVYCHGATLTGGGKPTPAWTGAASLTCSSCHGFPPASGHPTVNVSAGAAACNGCHPGTVLASGAIDVARGLHINGTVDLGSGAGGGSCTACHGDAARVAVAGADANVKAAPPATATGASPGAHQAHVNGGAAAVLHAPYACAECHVVPTAVPHSNGTVDIVFGASAKVGGAAPAWNATAGSCAATYCHGTLPGADAKYGLAAAPTWANAASGQCGTCHGIPPAGATGHPQRTDCGACHDGYTQTTVNLALHVNGVKDVSSTACTGCHGDPNRAAKPGTDGNIKAAPPVVASSPTPGAGAHLAHVYQANPSPLSAPLACSECHVVPADTAHAGQPVNVTFGTLAKTGGKAPAYSTTAFTCASTYCHGNFAGGNGAGATPAWSAVGPLGCTACHGAPPVLPHPQNTSCGTCHPGYTATSVNVLTHVNGVVDQTGTGCTQCHGTPGRTTYAAEAPPIDTKGNTVTTSRGVGAHATHLTAGGL
ncbi:MAG: CxxxxCH/CxxCH domain c-type cytochrome, partial [Anaeromyxobacteraceae bacterium]